MRKIALTFVAACMYYSGLVALARWWTRRQSSCLIVLNYHRALGGDLRRQFLYLRRHYRVMHVEAALEELYARRKNGRRSYDRRTPLVLTFDDGYRDNYTHAFALARELQIPFTIYLVPGYIESGRTFWWLEGERLVKHAQVKEVTLDDRCYHLQDPQEKAALAQLIDGRVRYAQTVDERETFLAMVSEKLAVSAELSEDEMLALPVTWEQVHEMETSGWVSFGAHTMHHPILAYLKDAAEMREELESCSAALAEQLGHPVRTFAYPIGQLQHISDEVLDAVRQAGYDWAFTTRYGFNRRKGSSYLLNRVEVDTDQHWLVVAAEAAGLWGFFSRLRWLPFVRKYLTNSGQK
ncbi:polysaccharide deacetylase family protein [Ktedonosporobacter rubrisoli]|uniref:Polysaccharide deacetylase family protein n=1 Tax=Ktedonosporobacter rubrisoli TaxID=2509675 RepID=A0A4V0YZ39_KTERU|nr:polysaccharide deacetylase family protein [Ktedonosporobacter rubrisoli]QBD78381.1 polysaccharide deacetylase family protein [Ktedonosporobacter rubrisoli]